MFARLKVGEEESVVPPLELEEDVRRARVGGRARVLYPPWTGEEWREIQHIPELHHALGTAEARFAAALDRQAFPWATVSVVAILIFAGILQFFVAGTLLPVASAEDALAAGAFSYDALVMDGAWWTAWSSQLLHVNPAHLLGNLAIIGYCGFRTERALGPGGYVLVVAAAVACGGLFILGFGDWPVVGSSVLGYGVWGAQIAIGFRMGPAIPARYRGFYGWGNFIFFVPLFLLGLDAEGVSHAGHLGGLLGGCLAATLPEAETMLATELAPRRRRQAFLLAGALLVLPVALSLASGLSPAFAAFPSRTVKVPTADFTLSLPWRFREVRLAGMPAWTSSAASRTPIFCGHFQVADPGHFDGTLIQATWAEHFQAEVSTPVPLPDTPEGWSGWSFRVETSPAFQVVEYDRLDGSDLVRVGYLHEQATTARRRALYRHLVGTLSGPGVLPGW